MSSTGQVQNKILVEDWKDFKDSILFNLSIDNYQKDGVDVFNKEKSKNMGGTIPYRITCSYIAAKNYVHFIKEHLDDLLAASDNETIKILEIASGSGLWAMNFLLAARDEGILEKVCVYVSDFARSSLIGMQELGIFKDFEEGKHYDLFELDMTDPNSCKKLNGDKFALKNLSLIVMNYAIDALPTNILYKNENGLASVLQVQVEIDADKFKDISEVSNFKSDLIINHRLRQIDWDNDEPSIKEKKDLIEFLIKDLDNNQQIIFPNLAEKTILEFSKLLTAKGLIITADFPKEKNIDHSGLNSSDLFKANDIKLAKEKQVGYGYNFFRNTVAVSLDIPAYEKLCEFNNIQMTPFFSLSNPLCYLFITKDQDSTTLENYKNDFNQIFIRNNSGVKMQTLDKIIDLCLFPEFKAILGEALKVYSELDPYSAELYFAKAKYYELEQDYIESQKYFKKAFEVDYLEKYGKSPFKK